MTKRLSFKVGDKVKIIDGSYAVRLDSYETRSCIGLCQDTFKIIQLVDTFLVERQSDTFAHDIVIQSTSTGKIYLHSSCMVELHTDICKCCEQEIK